MKNRKRSRRRERSERKKSEVKLCSFQTAKFLWQKRRLPAICCMLCEIKIVIALMPFPLPFALLRRLFVSVCSIIMEE